MNQPAPTPFARERIVAILSDPKAVSAYSVGTYKSCMGSDGEAFDATLRLDGKVVGHVYQSGNGGCNEYHFKSREQNDAFMAWAKAHPVIEWYEANWGFKITTEQEDTVFGFLVTLRDIRKRIKKGTFVYATPDMGPDEFGTAKVGRKVAPFNANCILWAEKSIAEVVILNTVVAA